MSLVDEYRRQSGWRDRVGALDALPPLEGCLVMDLGCGLGDVAEQLVGRGARVLGVDLDEELLAVARSRDLPGADFVAADLREPFRLPVEVDGLWGSFLAAYFVDLPSALRRWSRHLRPGGWIALTEIDDLFGHAPLAARTRELLDAYAEEALEQGRYDFRMGRKLGAHLEAAGFHVTRELTLHDRELAFTGPAPPEILDAWSRRFDRMKPLHDVCGSELPRVKEDFLGCLANLDHTCTANIHCCVAAR